MNILLASVGDNGGGCWFLAHAINKYTAHYARAVRWQQTYIRYPCDVVEPTERDIERLENWADIIHIRDGAPLLEQSPKFRAITFTGVSYRKKAALLVEHYARQRVFVSTPDLLAYHPQPVWMPNTREAGVNVGKHRPFTVAHAPTYRARKGTQTVIEACKLAGVKLELIEGASYHECLRRKARCHLLIDQFSFGYGNNAIEAWALGLPVISGAVKPAFQAESRRLCSGELPYYDCKENVEELAAAIGAFASNRPLRDEWAGIGRDYFLRVHSAAAVAERAARAYEEML